MNKHSLFHFTMNQFEDTVYSLFFLKVDRSEFKKRIFM